MAEAGVGTIPLRPDYSEFTGSKISRGIDPAIDDTDRHLHKRFKGVFGSVAALGGGILAAGVVTGFLSSAVSEAREAAKIGRITEQLVRSTGGAANLTAGQVADLSERMSNLAAVDDELVQEGANVLLTFKNIRNEVGEGNNIFDRATESALDMSTVLGTDLKSANVLLGKALNDPIKGVTSLTRAGVTFTEQQKDQIRVLVESGDVLGAQQLILAEVEGQMGGAAAAAAEPMEKLQVAAGNLAEEAGTVLIPALEKGATFLAETLIPALRNTAQWVGDNIPLIIGLGAGITAALVPAFIAWAAAAIPAAALTLAAAAPVIALGVAVGALAVLVVRNWDTIKATFQAGKEWIVDMAHRAVDGFMGAIRALPGLLGGFVHGDLFMWFATDAIPFLVDQGKRMGGALVDWIVDAIKKLPRLLLEALKDIGGGLVDFGKGVAAKIGGGLLDLGASLAERFDGAGRTAAPAGFAGGNTLARVRPLLPAGAYITSTYRDPATNRRIGGSPTSYHLDRNNPAVDIGGSTSVLNALHARLRAMGGWRELIWQAPGHYDHIHVAHQGGYVTPQGIAPLRSDELLTKLQVGETVLPRGMGAGQTVIINAPERDAASIRRDFERWAWLEGAA